MLRRKIYSRLQEWKGRKHKSLLISGQRQVGKTYAIRRFGSENYKNVVFIDFSKDAVLKRVFNGNLDVDTITGTLELYLPDAVFEPGSTLIVFDEIQECPRARTSMKYFTEDGRYDVIASGSLLGIDMHNTTADPGDDDAPLPVGYEEQMVMYSLDFEEFLWANGVSESIISDVKRSIREKRPIPEPIDLKMNDLLMRYLILGGMPEVVQTYIDTGSYRSAFDVMDSIIKVAVADMNRYNTPINANKVGECFRSIPAQLAGSNKKFMYSRIDGTGSRQSAQKYSKNLLWIKDAGYGNFSYRLRSIEVPLMAMEDRDQFKVYLSDTGLLVDMYGDAIRKAIFENDPSVNMGAIAENFVAECLMKAGIAPRYYNRNSKDDRLELDFVIESGSELAVIEVKSGTHRTAKSLMKVSKLFDIDRRMLFGDTTIYVSDDGVEHYPLYAAAFIGETIHQTFDDLG